MNVGDKDQVKAGLRDFAEILAAYKKSLVEQGFTQLEIISLLTTYQTALLFPDKRR